MKNVYKKCLIGGGLFLWHSSIFCPPVGAQVAYHPGSVVGWSDPQVDDLLGVAPYDIMIDALNIPQDLVKIPKGFRTSFQFKAESPIKTNLKGLSTLRMSGAAQFSRNRGESLLRHLEKTFQVKRSHVYIVDLREEPHGHINNHAVTWYYGPLSVQKYKSPSQVLGSVQMRVDQVKAFQAVYLNTVIKNPDGMPFNKVPLIVPFTSAETERDLVSSLGANYVLFPVTDHFRPEDDSVDAFIEFVETIRNLPHYEDIWLHFKCRGGRGRTTTFMLIYDMMMNPEVSVPDLIQRQKMLGGVDLARLSTKKHFWKRRLDIGKMQFIQSLYDYFHAPDGYGVLRWSDWTRKHNQQSSLSQHDVGMD